MTLPSVLGCQVCSALEKQNVPKDIVFFSAKCPSAIDEPHCVWFACVEFFA